MSKGKPCPFFQKPSFEIVRTPNISKEGKEPTRKPKVKSSLDEADNICLKLAKAGYKGGDPELIGMMNPYWVIKMIEYESFCGEYEEEYINLNQNNG